MKKINSIGYAHKIIGLIGFFLTVLPFCCYILNLIIHTALLTIIMYMSLAIGILVMIYFIGLLFIEFHQDKKINKQYSIIIKNKIKLNNGFYECQSCGNRNVIGVNKCCNVCGTTFNEERNNFL